MGLAAFTVPLVASNAGAATGVEATSELAESPQPKPKPKKNKKGAAKGGKLVKASDTPLGTTEDVPVNSGMLFESEEYIVTQPKPGKYVGFDALCTHEGCPVDVFEEGKMKCSCHGAEYTLDSGKPTAGPARKPLPKKPIIVEGNNIYKAKPA